MEGKQSGLFQNQATFPKISSHGRIVFSSSINVDLQMYMLSYVEDERIDQMMNVHMLQVDWKFEEQINTYNGTNVEKIAE